MHFVVFSNAKSNMLFLCDLMQVWYWSQC